MYHTQWGLGQTLYLNTLIFLQKNVGTFTLSEIGIINISFIPIQVLSPNVFASNFKKKQPWNFPSFLGFRIVYEES